MNALHYAKQLVSLPSPSFQSNADVADYVQRALRELQFETERVEYHDAQGVKKVNVLGKKGRGEAGLTFFGHLDTVPVDGWKMGSPFEPTEQDGRLYGRGSCDMKGPVASVLAAAATVPPQELNRALYVVCTADEEVGYGGAAEVAARSVLFRELRQGYGIISEPTRLGVVYAHKGTVAITATARGRAAHSSTNKGINANLKMIPFLSELKRIHDELQSDPALHNHEFDPPTAGWNIGINDGNPVLNITAPRSVATVYYRPMPGQDVEAVLARVRHAAAQNDLALDIRCTGQPLYTDPNSTLVRRVMDVAGADKAGTVAYGTDGMVFGQHMQVVVFGPGDIAQAHTDDEWIALEQLDKATALNRKLIQTFCC